MTSQPATASTEVALLDRGEDRVATEDAAGA